MGLRLAEGIDPEALAQRFGQALIDAAATARLQQLGLVERSPGRLRVTPPGRLLLDRILAEIAA
jgi:oxygen-independent coproporphyrinogen-3 oxidase